MRMSRFLIVALAALTACGAGAALAQDFSAIPVRTLELAENVHVLAGAGGNVMAVSGPGGVLLVDADYVEMAGKLDDAVAALDSGPVRLVVDTHWHFDHVGGNEALNAAGAVIAAHRTALDWMAAPQHLDVLDHDVEASPAGALPSLLIDDALTVRWGAETVEIRHLPAGHTGGDLIVHLPGADVLHAGDLFFNCGYPYIDTAHGGTIDGMIANVDTLIGMCGPDTRIVPGHGPVGTLEDLRAFRDMLQRFRDAVAPLVAEGKSLEEILAAKATAEVDAEFGSAMFPPAEFTHMVYLSLQGD